MDSSCKCYYRVELTLYAVHASTLLESRFAFEQFINKLGVAIITILISGYYPSYTYQTNAVTHGFQIKINIPTMCRLCGFHTTQLQGPT